MLLRPKYILTAELEFLLACFKPFSEVAQTACGAATPFTPPQYAARAFSLDLFTKPFLRFLDKTAATAHSMTAATQFNKLPFLNEVAAQCSTPPVKSVNDDNEPAIIGALPSSAI